MPDVILKAVFDLRSLRFDMFCQGPQWLLDPRRMMLGSGLGLPLPLRFLAVLCPHHGLMTFLQQAASSLAPSTLLWLGFQVQLCTATRKVRPICVLMRRQRASWTLPFTALRHSLGHDSWLEIGISLQMHCEFPPLSDLLAGLKFKTLLGICTAEPLSTGGH